MAGSRLAGGGVLLAVLLAAGGAPAGGDPAEGRRLARACVTCHGADGIARIPIAPNIGGEPEAYLAEQLRAFRDGRRAHEMMTIVARDLSDEAIAHLVAWYHSRRIAATPPAGRDPGPAGELCAGCHGEDGIALIPEAPNLAGESVVYIETQVKAYRAGRRVQEAMSEVAAAVTDAELRAAAEWYAAIAIAPAGD